MHGGSDADSEDEESDRIIGSEGDAATQLKSTIDRLWEEAASEE